MKRILFLFLLGITASAQAQLSFNTVATRPPAISDSPIKPEPGSVLNHTQIMFEYPAVKKAADYRIVVSELVPVKNGSKTDTTKTVVVEQADHSTATLIDGLKFGSRYSWYYLAFDATGKQLSKSPEYRFSTHYFPETDPAVNRFRVIKNNRQAVSGLVTMDYAHVIVNREANPVWCLNPVIGEISPSDLIRDMRITPQGTITLLTTHQVYELDINGKILWKGPNDGKISGDKTEYYHHDFKRLPNGNYMAMSNEIIVKKLPDGSDTVRVNYGTLIEYPYFGKPVWVWHSKSYFKDSEIFNSKTPQGKPQASLHLNAFSVDQNGEYVYAGFRDMNRVLKIRKSTGEVVGDYGNKLFWHQHDANVLSDGTIAVFNNDSIDDPKITSSAVVFRPGTASGQKPEVTWKMDCKFDSLSDGKSVKMGSIDLLPNDHFLINMGGVNRIIEVTRDKKILWDVMPETFVREQNKWEPSKQYRSHYASSLYPCYFTIQASTETWKKSTKEVQLLIVNEGTDADTYLLTYKISGAAGAPVIMKVGEPVEGGKQTMVTVQPALPLSKGQVLEIKVASVTNPVFTRTVTVSY